MFYNYKLQDNKNYFKMNKFYNIFQIIYNFLIML